MLLIVVVLGSIYAGIATATEAAAFGVVGSLVLSAAQRSLGWETFRDSLLGATRLYCMIALILAGAAFLTLAMGYIGLPRELAEWIATLGLSPFALIVALALFYIVLGCFLDGISMVVLTMGVILPTVEKAGIDLLWFGIFIVLVVEMAQITPPVGLQPLRAAGHDQAPDHVDRASFAADVLPDLRRGARDLVLPATGDAAAAAHEAVSEERDTGVLIDAFCDQLWLQDGLAASSLASYRRDLAGFGAWLAKRGLPLLAVERAHFDHWLADQFQAKAKATSVARRLSALRRFYRFQLARGAIAEDPTLRVRAPKKPRRLPKHLSEAQVEALLAAPDTRTALGVRDRAMLETLYATGLRVSELTGLKRSQVAHDAGVVRVVGKGSKERLVPMGDEAVAGFRVTCAKCGPPWRGRASATRSFSPSATARSRARPSGR